MLKKSDLGRLLDYTNWANHRVVRAAATLSKDDFKRDLRSSHGGVRGTLTHMLAAEWVWLERFKGVSPAKFTDEAEFPDVMALRERWNVVERHRQAWYESLREKDAAGIVAYRNTAGQAFEAPLWQLVQHVANHSTYHRGQVITLLRQLGARPVATDLVTYDREASAKSKET